MFLLISPVWAEDATVCESWAVNNGAAPVPLVMPPNVIFAPEIVIQLYPFGIRPHQLHAHLLNRRYRAVSGRLPLPDYQDTATGWFVYSPRVGNRMKDLGVIIRENAGNTEVEVLAVFQVTESVIGTYRELLARRRLQ